MKAANLWLVPVFAGAIAASSSARGESFSSFGALDRHSRDSMVGIDLGLGFIEPGPLDNDQALRLELHGQYLIDDDVGLYGMLPFSRLFVEGFDSSMAMGNLELGGFYVAPLSDFDLTLRGGFALPTADSGDFFDIIAGEIPGAFSNFVAHSVRITDLALAFPDTTWLRLSASPTLRSGDAFFRADVGVDVPLRSDFDADPLIRINAGGGLDLDRLSLLAELAMLFDSDGDDLISAAFTARFHGQQLRPGVSLLVPINDALRDVLDLGLVFGLQVHLD